MNFNIRIRDIYLDLSMCVGEQNKKKSHKMVYRVKTSNEVQTLFYGINLEDALSKA